MAILGGFYRVTGLSPTGLPGSIIGLWARSPMIPLNFTLQVAGDAPGDFDAPPQLCQAVNDQIQLVVTIVDQNGLPINVRSATSRKIVLLTPQGTTIDRAAALYTSGVDGAVAYTTKATDLQLAGTYQIQAQYVIGGQTQTTRWGKFRVGANIE
jgi:hypothetical protein